LLLQLLEGAFQIWFSLDSGASGGLTGDTLLIILDLKLFHHLMLLERVKLFAVLNSLSEVEVVWRRRMSQTSVRHRRRRRSDLLQRRILRFVRISSVGRVLIPDGVQQVIDPITNLSKLLFHVSGQLDGRRLVSDGRNHLSVDEEGQLEEARVGDGAGQIRAVE
jgi:hypothetical protein